MVQEAKINNAEKALGFILAGNATFTLRSLKTGSRYTYKVRQADDKPLWFVNLLTGPDNNSDYTYLGLVSDNTFRLTKKSQMTDDSVPVVAFRWFLGKLVQQTIPEQVELWHAGRCGRCGRTLTVPESVESGFGPECVTKI